MNKCFKQQTPRHKLDMWAHASGAVLISHQRPSHILLPFLLPCTEPWCSSLWSGGATLLKLPNFSCPAGDDTSYILRNWSLFRRKLLTSPSRLLHFPLPLPLPSFLQRPSWALMLWHNVSRLLSLCSWILSLSLSWFFPSSLEKVTIRNPDGPVVGTRAANARGHRFDPGWGTKDPRTRVVWPKK